LGGGGDGPKSTPAPARLTPALATRTARDAATASAETAATPRSARRSWGLAAPRSASTLPRMHSEAFPSLQHQRIRGRTQDLFNLTQRELSICPANLRDRLIPVAARRRETRSRSGVVTGMASILFRHATRAAKTSCEALLLRSRACSQDPQECPRKLGSTRGLFHDLTSMSADEKRLHVTVQQTRLQPKSRSPLQPGSGCCSKRRSKA